VIRAHKKPFLQFHLTVAQENPEILSCFLKSKTKQKIKKYNLHCTIVCMHKLLSASLSLVCTFSNSNREAYTVASNCENAKPTNEQHCFIPDWWTTTTPTPLHHLCTLNFSTGSFSLGGTVVTCNSETLARASPSQGKRSRRTGLPAQPKHIPRTRCEGLAAPRA